MQTEGEQETATPPPTTRYASSMQEREGDEVVTLPLQPSTEWKHSVEGPAESSKELSVGAKCESKDSHSAGTSLPKGRRRLALALREAPELSSVNVLTLSSLKRKAQQPGKEAAKVPRTEKTTSPKPATRSVAEYPKPKELPTSTQTTDNNRPQEAEAIPNSSIGMEEEVEQKSPRGDTTTDNGLTNSTDNLFTIDKVGDTHNEPPHTPASASLSPTSLRQYATGHGPQTGPGLGLPASPQPQYNFGLGPNYSPYRPPGDPQGPFLQHMGLQLPYQGQPQSPADNHYPGTPHHQGPNTRGNNTSPPLRMGGRVFHSYLAPIKGSTKTDLLTYNKWVTDNNLPARLPAIKWGRASCTPHGTIQIPMTTYEEAISLKSIEGIGTWTVINNLGNNTSLDSIIAASKEVTYLAPLMITPVYLDSLPEAAIPAFRDRCGHSGRSIWGPPTHLQHYKVKSAVSAHIWYADKRAQILRNPTVGVSMIHPAEPEEGREDKTSRNIYNSNAKVEATTEELGEALARAYGVTARETTPIAQYMDPSTGTYLQKWFVGFGRPDEAERFATRAREMFPSINSERGWNLTIGGNKGPNPTKKTTEKPTGRGAGKGGAKRARGGKK